MGLVNYIQAFENVDNWGHFGGMITGFAIGYLIFDTIDPPTLNDKYSRITTGALLGLYFVGGIILFYTAVDSNSD